MRSSVLTTSVASLTAAAVVLGACSGSDHPDQAEAATTTPTTETAEATTTSAPATTRLRLDYQQEPPIVGTPVCEPETSCVIPFSLLGSATGDFDGVTVQSGGGVAMPDGSLYANSTILFTGTVSGCGTGTVVMRSTGFNRDGVTSGTVEIVESSGTGDLVNLTGTGEILAGEAAPDGTGTGGGALELEVTC